MEGGCHFPASSQVTSVTFCAKCFLHKYSIVVPLRYSPSLEETFFFTVETELETTGSSSHTTKTFEINRKITSVLVSFNYNYKRSKNFSSYKNLFLAIPCTNFIFLIKFKYNL